jgi:hypothetical protein
MRPVLRSFRYLLDGRAWEARFDARDTVANIVKALNTNTPHNDIVALLDGDVRLDGTMRVVDLSEIKIYNVGLRRLGPESSSSGDPPLLCLEQAAHVKQGQLAAWAF